MNRLVSCVGGEGNLLDETPLEEERQQYCERIMLPRLYGLLPPAAQVLVSRLAVKTCDAVMGRTITPPSHVFSQDRPLVSPR